jgi:hypothetical protein
MKTSMSYHNNSNNSDGTEQLSYPNGSQSCISCGYELKYRCHMCGIRLCDGCYWNCCKCAKITCEFHMHDWYSCKECENKLVNVTDGIN